ncbi:MAG TPA: substrate-binding domain-containing protein [Microlunatus sp.]
MKKNRTTLADVADAAGVSVATVSKVLNDHTDVAEPTRRRIQQLLRESGYQPTRRSARRSEEATDRLIEVSFPEWQNAYETAVLDGLSAAAEAGGYEIVIGPRAHDNRVDIDPDELRRSGRVGAIFVTVDATHPPIKALADGFPVVVIDPVRVGATRCVSIGATNFAGGVTATEHLLSLGHRRIAHAGGPSSVECSQARVAGYYSALRQAGLTLDDSLVTHSLFTYDAGREVAARLLDRHDRPTAIFAACDEIALGILEEARRRAIRVPEDLSLIGFDDSFLASRSAPPLTTVAQPLIEMGQLAVRSLLQLAAGEVVGTRHLELATHLVVRDSTAAPRS